MLDQVRLGFLVLALISFCAQAQEVEVRGRFRTDSIKIGQPFPYSLSATYPKNTTVLFPDSTYSFSPFEIDHKKFFATKTTGDTSYDSVVYFITSFEIDTIQRISLPVFVVNKADCTAVFAKTDSVFLQQMVSEVPDSVTVEQLPLKTNTAYQAVSWLLNYPLLLIIGGVIIVIIIVTWIVFGKRIKQYFILKRLNKGYILFKQEFESAIHELENSYSTQRAETTLSMWKQYMEQLLSRPYTKYTTKEIFQMVKNEKLAGALKQIDRTIYSGSQTLESAPLYDLKEYTEQKFHDKVQEVKNG
ncbi:MAG: hypothetical protein KDC93_01795 [Cyclobacteriaceae bacterium]|nr:hypothetical protein [Cyclobacteriaceae bacterium]